MSIISEILRPQMLNETLSNHSHDSKLTLFSSHSTHIKCNSEYIRTVDLENRASSDHKWKVNIWGQWMLNQNVLPETLKSTTACLSKPLLLKVGKHYSLLLKPQHTWKVWWVIGRCQDTISISQTQGKMHSLALQFTNMEIKDVFFNKLIWGNFFIIL